MGMSVNTPQEEGREESKSDIHIPAQSTNARPIAFPPIHSPHAREMPMHHKLERSAKHEKGIDLATIHDPNHCWQEYENAMQNQLKILVLLMHI